MRDKDEESHCQKQSLQQFYVRHSTGDVSVFGICIEYDCDIFHMSRPMKRRNFGDLHIVTIA
jgi:hypothetical protein